MGVQAISVPQHLAYVLNQAGNKSGVDFDYLLQTAIRESSLNPEAKAQTSSATGLFQFIESTWLEVMQAEGPRLGYSSYAAAIETGPDGTLFVQDPALRQEILQLREEPQIAADLAAAFTKRNGDYLQERFGRMPSAGELYIAHFLGARGAEALFQAGLDNPDQLAAPLFPRQADANQAIFHGDGGPRTIREVYQALVLKHDGGTPSASFTAQQLASGPLPPVEATPLVTPTDVNFTNLFVGSATLTSTGDSMRDPMTPKASPGNGFFVQLFGQGEMP